MAGSATEARTGDLDLPRNVAVVTGTDVEKVKASLNELGTVFSARQIGDDLILVLFDGRIGGREDNVRTSVPVKYTEVLAEIESRTVFMQQIDQHVNEEELKKHMETVGRVLDCQLVTEKKTAVVQYATKESRDEAIEKLHGTVINHGKPICVLRYVHNRLQHAPAGFLQLNELKSYESTTSLRKEFMKWGFVLATTITPSWNGENNIGYVLFEKYEDACKAEQECGRVNVMLTSPCNQLDVQLGFAESAKSPAQTIVAYNITEDEKSWIEAGHGNISSAHVAVEDGKRTGYMSFDNGQQAVSVFNELKVKYAEVDLLGENALKVSLLGLRTRRLPEDWQYCVFYVKNIDNGMTNAELRDLFNYLAPVRAVFQRVTFSAAIVLFEPHCGELEGRRCSIGRRVVTLTPYDTTENAQPRCKEPTEDTTEWSAKRILSTLVKLNCAGDDVTCKKYLAHIDNMSIMDAMRLARCGSYQLMLRRLKEMVK